METVGDRIKAKRKELGLTQLSLAEKLNVTDRAVSKWEQNEGNPDFNLLPELANQLGVSLDYLITGKIVEPVINLDDMDSLKRAEYLAQKDDADNFCKYGYIDLDILLDTQTKETINRRSNNNKYYEKIREIIIENRSFKIFSLLLDKFVDFCNDKKNEKYLQNVFSGAFYVETILDDFVQMSAILGRIDVLELIKVKWFNGTSIVQLKEQFKPFGITNATIEKILSNPNVPSYVVDYLCEPVFLMVLKRREMFEFTTQIPIVGTQFDTVLLHFYKSNNNQRIKEILDYLYENLRKNTKEYQNYTTADDIRSGYRNVTKTYKNGICYSHQGADSYDYYTYYCAVPMINKALSVAKADCNVEMVKMFNDYNKEVGATLHEKVDCLSEEDIEELRVKANPDASDDDKTIAANTRMGLLNYKGVSMPFVGSDDVDKLKKSILEAKRIYDHILSKEFIHYMELVETYVGEKNYKALFEFASDYGLTSLENAALEMNDEQIVSAARDLFLPSEEHIKKVIKVSNDLTENARRQADTRTRYYDNGPELRKQLQAMNDKYLQELSKKYPRLSDMITRQMSIIPIQEYCQIDISFSEYCHDLKISYYENFKKHVEEKIESITKEKKLREEYDKATAELTNEYFSNLLARKETELFIIKLCSLLDVIFKFKCRIPGEDFHARMQAYFDNGPKSRDMDDGWGYMVLDTEWEEKEVKPWNARRDLFNRLRMQRNNIAHGEKTKVQELMVAELQECMNYVLSLQK